MKFIVLNHETRMFRVCYSLETVMEEISRLRKHRIHEDSIDIINASQPECTMTPNEFLWLVKTSALCVKKEEF